MASPADGGSQGKGRVFNIRMITVEPILFLYMFGSNLQFPTFQALVYKKTCLQSFNKSFCDDMDNKTFQKLHEDEQDQIQSDSSYWIMLSNVGMTLPSIFVVMLFVGSWGDRVNRKVPILVPCVGALIYNLCNLINSHFMDWSLNYLMIGPVFNGIFGGYITVLMGTYSYTIHISGTRHKTTRVGIVESMTFFAGTISVFVSGLLLSALGYVAVFGLVCGCVGVASLYGVFWLESVRPESGDHRESCCNSWFLGALADTLRCIKRRRVKSYLSIIILEITVLSIMQLCTTGENDILFLFLKRSPRSFTSIQYGYFKGTENFTRSVALLTLLPFLKYVLHLRDSTVVIIGISSKAAGLIVLGLADNITLIFLVVVFAMLQGFPAAGLRASMSSLVDKDEQGRLFGIVAAAESCVSLAATFIFNGLYPVTLDTFDGICFEFAAAFCGLALLVTIYIHVKLKSVEQKEESTGQSESSGDAKLDIYENMDKQILAQDDVVKTRL